MAEEKIFALVGGDRRQLELAKLLRAEGHRVLTYGLGGAEPAAEELTRADCVILPVPVLGAGGTLRAPLAERPISPADLLDRLRPGQVICAGQVPEPFLAAAHCRGLTLEDYAAREEFMVGNAVPTAEGALYLAMERKERVLCGTETLVLGWGRIGRLLALRLAALGARVTVTARRPGDLAGIRGMGLRAAPTGAPELWPEGVELVFNTVPAPVLDERALARLAPGALVLDLASQPGGTDFTAAARLGLHAFHEPGLPGRMAPCTAAACIRDTVCHILSELGE